MSFRRPAAVPRWAWGGAATLVQPPSGSAEAGFATRQEPPAQWFNWQFNATGAWIDFLRGPGVERWTRAAWAASLNSPSKVPFDVETGTSDAGATSSAFRFAAVGDNSSPAPRIHASQTGATWVQRTNLPAGIAGPYALKALDGRWLLAGDNSGTTVLYYTAADDGTGAGAIGANGNAWTAATNGGTGAEVRAFAQLGSAGNIFAACATGSKGMVSSDNGATWADATFGTSPTGDGRDVVTTATKYVFVSQDGEVFTSGDGVTFAQTTTLAAGSGTWQLAAGDTATGTGEVVAWRVGQSTSVDLYRSTDSGTSFSAVTQTDAPKYITSLRWAEGVWVATSSRSPWLWVSNDLASWRALSPPVDTSSLSAALYSVAWDGGAWTAIGNGFALQCDRAADPSGGLYVASDSPSTLADAGSFRGRLLSTTAPTNGQVLAWNSSTERWTPTASGSSPTTTRGDLIRRGASADERFAAKAADTFVGGDGTDVVSRTKAQVRTSLGLDRREPAGSPTPLLWWKCDETDVTASTVANSGSTGSSDGSITNGTAGARGPWGEPAVQLLGSGYIRSPVDVVRPTSAITVALWWRQPALDDARLVWRPYGATWAAPYVAASLFINGSGVPSGSVSISGTERVAAASSLVARAGEWHHSALTYDGTTLKVYLDGVLVASASVSGSIDYGADPTTTRWHVGGSDLVAGDRLTGEVADVRIHDAAQSAAWVARVFKRGLGAYDGT